MGSTEYTQLEWVAGSIIVCMAIISILAGLITVRLILFMKKWNGYILVVYYLTLSQLIYDLAFFLLIGFKITVCRAIYSFISITSGTCVTLWTNVISAVLYYIVVHRAHFNLKDKIPRILTIVLTSGFAVGGLNLYFHIVQGPGSPADLLYYWLRIGSILFNAAVYAVIYFTMRRMGIYKSVDRSTGRCNDPLYLLVGRVKYYPIVQIFARAGAAWWEYAYGFSYKSYDQSNFTTEKWAAEMLYAVSNPSAGLGYFIVFLIVQPFAYQSLVSLMESYWCPVYLCGLKKGKKTPSGSYPDEEDIDELQNNGAVNPVHIRCTSGPEGARKDGDSEVSTIGNLSSCGALSGTDSSLARPDTSSSIISTSGYSSSLATAPNRSSTESVTREAAEGGKDAARTSIQPAMSNSDSAAPLASASISASGTVASRPAPQLGYSEPSTGGPHGPGSTLSRGSSGNPEFMVVRASAPQGYQLNETSAIDNATHPKSPISPSCLTVRDPTSGSGPFAVNHQSVEPAHGSSATSAGIYPQPCHTGDHACASSSIVERAPSADISQRTHYSHYSQQHSQHDYSLLDEDELMQLVGDMYDDRAGSCSLSLGRTRSRVHSRAHSHTQSESREIITFL